MKLEQILSEALAHGSHANNCPARPHPAFLPSRHPKAAWAKLAEFHPKFKPPGMDCNCWRSHATLRLSAEIRKG